MRVIIAGSRTLTDFTLVEQAIQESGFTITEAVCGEAPGIDILGRRWAEMNGIPVVSFPADWKKYGKAAGRIRNAQMGAYGEALIAITTGSPGTKNMISIARAKKLPTFVVEVPDSTSKQWLTR